MSQSTNQSINLNKAILLTNIACTHAHTHTHTTHTHTHTPIHLHIYQLLLDHFVLQTVQEFQRKLPPIRGGWKEKGSKNGLLNNLILSNPTLTLSSLWPPQPFPSVSLPVTHSLVPPIPVYAADYVSGTQVLMGKYKYVIIQSHSENLINGLGNEN